MERKFTNSHADKANSYDIGRPNYPDIFFEYLYNELGFTKEFVIADIGAGTGKITRKFLEMGNKVYAVEPDKDMIDILKNNLSKYSNCFAMQNTAEKTEIPKNSADLIFCGNSYHWFDRNYVIPEFKRIIKKNSLEFNIIITSLGSGSNAYDDEFFRINKEFTKSSPSKISNTSPPFLNEVFTSKTFEYIVYEGWTEFLNGCLSASYTPTQDGECFNEYCEALKELFEKHSRDNKLEANFKLFCMMGCIENLG